MLIGVPKEIKVRESRVGLVPNSVAELTGRGHSVLVETGAGAGIGAGDDAYRAAGGEIDEKATRFWEILGTLKWGIMCGVLMVSAFESGADPSIERGSIGRRASETEIDLLRMLMGED